MSDPIRELLTQIRLTQLSQQKDLEKHIQRSEANEKRLDLLEKVYNDLNTHLLHVEGAIKGAKYFGGLLGFIWLCVQLVDHYK